MVYLNKFLLSEWTENPKGLIQANKWEIFTPDPHILLILALPQAKSNCTKKFLQSQSVISIHYCASLGIAQSSSTVPFLCKWTTMKRDTYNEFQWKDGKVFAPETIPEKSIKKMFSGLTDTTNLKLKAPKSQFCGTSRQETYGALYSVLPEQISPNKFSSPFPHLSLKLQFDFCRLFSRVGFFFLVVMFLLV